MSPSRPVLLTTAALLAASAAPAVGQAAPPDVLTDPGRATTPWAGWDVPGPSGVGEPVRVTARDGAFAVLGRASGGVAPYLVQRIEEGRVVRRVGRVPVAARAAQDGVRPDLVSGGGRTLYLADGCEIRRSSDLGSTWVTARLPGCEPGTGIDLSAVDERTVWASTSWHAWRTVDGGSTWRAAETGLGSPLVARSADDAFGHGIPRVLGTPLASTTDGGATVGGQGFRPDDAEGRPGTFINVMPGLTAPALRPDGSVVVGFDRHVGVVPAQDTTGGEHRAQRVLGAGGPGDPRPTGVVCEPGGTCVVGLRTTDGARTGVLLRGDAFGATVAPPPSVGAASPATDAVVGLEPAGADRPTRVVGSANLGATPYRPLLSAAGGRADLGTGELLAVVDDAGLRVSADRGRTWTTAPDPTGLAQVARVDGALVALGRDGTVRTPEDGAWAPVADVSSVGPRAITASDDGLVVVGDRGIARLTGPTAPEVTASPSAVAGGGYDHVTASGAVVLAWKTAAGRTRAARSTDGGATWARATLPTGTQAVQLATPTVAYALVGRTLHRSTDGGRSFSSVTTAPSLGSAGALGARPASRLTFSSAKRGALITPAGPFVTGNGGRTLEPLAVPGAVTPSSAVVDGAAVTTQDPLTGTVLRHDGLLAARPPELTVRRASSVRRGRSGARTVAVGGRLTGVGAGEPVAIVGLDRRGLAPTLLRVARTDARGRFSERVRLTRSRSGVRLVYRGIVRADRTVRGATSRVLRIR